MKIVSCKLYNDQYELLRQFSKYKNKSKSEVIREALNEYFANHKHELAYKHLPLVTKRIKIYT